jgi:signal transduction histidine kinase
MTELAGALVGWQLGVSVGAGFLLIRSWKRRAVLNEALHELRRPIQAMALAAVPGERHPVGVDGSLRLAAAALERLDREINGGRTEGTREAVLVWPLLESAVGRWRTRAGFAGAALTLRRGATRAVVEGDRVRLSQAIDNLIVNAIEHGGPSIVIEAVARSGRLRVSVADSGGPERREPRRSPTEALVRFAGRRRRGHGLTVVRAAAAAHGGRFALHRSADGSRAVLELPLLGPDPAP